MATLQREIEFLRRNEDGVADTRDGEVVFTRGGYVSEAVNNDGFCLPHLRAVVSFFLRLGAHAL